MRRLATSLIIAVLLIGLSLSMIGDAQSSTWKQYGFNSSGFVVYDFDGDGALELLALPSYVIDNYVAIRSPYPTASSGFTVDWDLDGREELVLQYMSTYYVFRGMTALTSYSIPGKLVIDQYRKAFAVGNTVIYNSTTIVFHDATPPVFPITSDKRLYVIYLSGTSLRILDNTGWNVTVYAGDISEILGVGMYFGKFYVLGKARTGGSILLVYDAYQRAVSVTGFTIEFDKAVLFVAYSEAFIATSGSNVYRVYRDRAVLEYIGDVLFFDGSYMYIYRSENNTLDVYSPALSTVVKTYYLPVAPMVLGGRHPVIGFSDGSRTYVFVDAPPIVISLYAPSTVYAGEKFFYSLDVRNAVDYTLLLNGQPIPTTGYLTLNASGGYLFKASASNGIITEEREYIVKVLPRPISIRLRVEGVPRAFEDATMLVEVTDVRTGASITDTTCRVTVGSQQFDIAPWSRFTATLTPTSLTTNNIPVSIRCGDGSYYESKEHQTLVFAYSSSPQLDVEYLGEGTLRVRLIAKDNKTEATGLVDIYVNERYVGRQSLPATITSIPPGENVIMLRYQPTQLVFAPSTYTLKVVYYENASSVPPELLSTVLLADVVKVVNVTETIEVPTPVTVPVEVPVEVPVLDATLTMVIAGGATAAGLVAGIFIPRILKVLKQRKTSTPVETEAGTEVDAEPA